MKNSFPLWAVGIGCSCQLLAAPFRNLDFEDYDQATLKLPGWHLFNSDPLAPQNENSIGLNQVSDGVYASMYTSKLPLGGNYRLGLHPFGDLFPWYLSQRGDIPADATSMSFEITGAQVSLKFDAIDLPLEYFYRRDVNLEGWNFVDVSAFAGKTVTLEIKATGITGAEIPGGFTGLDNFVFYSAPIPPIPEPGTLVVFVLGGVFAFFGYFSAKHQH